jgi:hypothetical protein
MTQIKRLGVASVSKTLLIVYGVIGLIVGALVSLISLLSAPLASGSAGAGARLLLGIGAIIAMPIFYGIVGAIVGAIVAWVYNLAAGFVGGIEVQLEPLGHDASTGQ